MFAFFLGMILPWDIQGVALKPCPAVSRGAADCRGSGPCQAQWVTSPQSLDQAAAEPEAKPPATGDVTLPEKQGQHPAAPPPLLLQLTDDRTGTSCTGHMGMTHIRHGDHLYNQMRCKTLSKGNWGERSVRQKLGSHQWQCGGEIRWRIHSCFQAELFCFSQPEWLKVSLNLTQAHPHMAKAGDLLQVWFPATCEGTLSRFQMEAEEMEILNSSETVLQTHEEELWR